MQLTNRLNPLGSGLTVFLDILVRPIAFRQMGFTPNSNSPIFRCSGSSFITDLFQGSEVGSMEFLREYINVQRYY
jgi:hypothetical protein